VAPVRTRSTTIETRHRVIGLVNVLGLVVGQDRFLYNFNEEWREKMGRPLNG
jgi:hypothetical protein